MGRSNRLSKGKLMRPNFFVFCEGKTEMAYVEYLRSLFRVPIQIIPRKSHSNISINYIEGCKKDYVTTHNDQTFLMFDLDVEGMLERLQKITDATLLVSNPCFEFWLLLHHESHSNELSSEACVKRLSLFFKRYKKGVLDDEEKLFLTQNMNLAMERAKKLEGYKNPSSTVYRLIVAIMEYQS